MNENVIALSYTILPGNVLRTTAQVNGSAAEPDQQYQLRLTLLDPSSSILKDETFVHTLPMTAECQFPYFDTYARQGGQLMLKAALSAEGISTVTQHLDIICYGYENYFNPSYSYRFSCQVSPTGFSGGQIDTIVFFLAPGKDCCLLEDPTAQFSYANDQGQNTVRKMTADRKGTKFLLKGPIRDADFSGGQSSFTWQCHVTYTPKKVKGHRESAFITLTAASPRPGFEENMPAIKTVFPDRSNQHETK